MLPTDLHHCYIALIRQMILFVRSAMLVFILIYCEPTCHGINGRNLIGMYQRWLTLVTLAHRALHVQPPT